MFRFHIQVQFQTHVLILPLPSFAYKTVVIELNTPSFWKYGNLKTFAPPSAPCETIFGVNIRVKSFSIREFTKALDERRFHF